MQMIIDWDEIIRFTNYHLKRNTEKVTEEDIKNYFGEPEDLIVEDTDDMMGQFEQQLYMAEVEMDKRRTILNSEDDNHFFTYEEMLLLPWQTDYNNRIKRNN